MLRWVLALLLGWWVIRGIKRVAAPTPPPPDDSRKDPLDPGRAVKASWTEVDEEGTDT